MTIDNPEYPDVVFRLADHQLELKAFHELQVGAQREAVGGAHAQGARPDHHGGIVAAREQLEGQGVGPDEVGAIARQDAAPVVPLRTIRVIRVLLSWLPMNRTSG